VQVTNFTHIAGCGMMFQCMHVCHLVSVGHISGLIEMPFGGGADWHELRENCVRWGAYGL